MAALLNRIHLNRYAIPALTLDDLRRELDHRSVLGGTRASRPVATWHIGGNGRPTCVWSVTHVSTDDFVPEPPSG